MNEGEEYERRFGVRSTVWDAHQKASEELFQPAHSRVVLWIQHWQQFEKISDFRIRNSLTLDETIHARLFEFREQIGRALAKGDYSLFSQISDFIQHGQPEDRFPVMAPTICVAFRQLIDEYQESANDCRPPITKVTVEVRASRLMAANLVRNEPGDQKLRLLEKRAKEIRKSTNWPRELRRCGLDKLPEARRGRKKTDKLR